MTKRDLVTEIEEKNVRASRTYLRGHLELHALEATFSRLKESESALLALHVMGLAACIEVSVREAAKILIDFGDPYFKRAERFKDHIRFDFSLTKALSTGQITFGDLISHSLPVSRLSHIASHFEVLFNDEGGTHKFQKIISEVREYVEPSDGELFGDDHAAITQQRARFLVDDPARLLSDVATVFEIRHLVAHEANFRAVTLNDLTGLMQSTRGFVDALYELVEQIQNPGVSRNGYGGSIQEAIKAGKVYAAAQSISERILAKIPRVGDDSSGLLEMYEATDRAFSAYHEAESIFQLALRGVASGNALRNIEANVTTRLWRHRTEYLTDVEEAVDFYAGLPKD
jgi:hypothetical protein